jgi:hypothetical protein
MFPGQIAPAIHLIGGWMGPRAGLDLVEKRKISCPCLESNPGRPAYSLSLYRLSFTGSPSRDILSFQLPKLTLSVLYYSRCPFSRMILCRDETIKLQLISYGEWWIHHSNSSLCWCVVRQTPSVCFTKRKHWLVGPKEVHAPSTDH